MDDESGESMEAMEEVKIVAASATEFYSCSDVKLNFYALFVHGLLIYGTVYQIQWLILMPIRLILSKVV